MKYLILTIYLSLTLTSCGTANVSSNSADVPVDNAGKSSAGNALQMADQECKKYNRRAIYVPDKTPDGQGSYQCVD